MDIDLLFTKSGEAGLICSENLVKKAIGAVLDIKTGHLALEYADMDHLDFNITVDPAFFDTLDLCAQLHLGAVKSGHIAQAYQIPLMFLDDPYRGEALKNMPAPKNPLVAFDHFIRSCVRGQPIHRENLDKDDSLGCVLGDSTPASLQFAPHLARRHTLEAAPTHAPNAPGLGLGGSTTIRTNQSGGNQSE